MKRVSKREQDRARAEIADHPLVKDGTIWIEGGEYVGRASDGTAVNLGNETQPESLVLYLASHPTPAHW